MMLTVDGITAHYDDAIVALEDVSMTVAQGGIVALLGPNGAGKTTLLKAIAGMLPFERGEVVDGDICFEDVSLIKRHPAEISRQGIALVQDGRQCFRELTIGENLRAASFAHVDGARERLEMVFSYFPFLRDMTGRLAGVLSGGQLQMLVVGMAIMCKPKLLLLDEPSLGLSPVMVQSVFDVVARLHQDIGLTVVIAEQTVPRLLKIASDVFVLSRGRVVMHAPPSAITEEDLQRIYLN
jgi:branched-chain amino acid transport system ATP-binding protein